MLGGAKLDKNFLLALAILFVLLTSCMSEPDAAVHAVGNNAPATNQLTREPEKESQVRPAEHVATSRSAAIPVPVATQTPTQVPLTTAHHTATPTQPPPMATQVPAATPGDTPAGMQTAPSLQTVASQPPTAEFAAPEIITFAASTDRLSPGESVTLTWETEGGEAATLCSVMNLSGPRTCTDVPPVGLQLFDVEIEANVYQFYLTVVNPSVASTSAYLEVCTDPSKLFFEDPPQKCGGLPPFSSYAAAQRFEHGLMIWLEATDEFFIFVDNPNQQTYIHIRGPLELKAGASVDNRVGGVPPGYYEPVSGFGLIWRGEVEWSTEWTRNNLGWALEPEFGYETVFQRGTRHGASWDAYIRGPDGRILYFFRVPMAGWFWDYVEQ